MDSHSHSKRDKSQERTEERKSSGEKRARDDHYSRNTSSSSSSRHHSHRDKRRNHGDESRSSRYDHSRSRDKHHDRSDRSYSRKGSKDRTDKSSHTSSSHNSSSHNNTSSSSHNNSSHNNSNSHNNNSSHNNSNNNNNNNNNNSSSSSHNNSSSTHRKDRSYYSRREEKEATTVKSPKKEPAGNIKPAETVETEPPTAPAAYYQDVQSQQAWASYYNWPDYMYQTEYTAAEYQQYFQYYQSQDPNGYYYYNPAYYQPEIPPPPTPINTTVDTQSTPDAIPEAELDSIGYPYQTPDDPSTLFEKIGQVGEGTYGKVYKARNGKTGKLMALKRIRMKTEKDGFPITAMREIKLLQKLKHERIVQLQEIMVSKGSVYMVLEYMDHDLSGILGHPNFNFEPAHAKSLVQQMLEGLAYLHQMGILHRDIKGSNLLINNKGELKIADFGLARVFQKNRAHDYTNRVITLWYRPPELLLGATAYGPAVDIWSVGCLMLEFFTGKAVFNGSDEISQLDSIYRIMGTPTVKTWPTVTELPWYELVKPNTHYVSKFRESYESLLSPKALELSEALLSMDPQKRPSAAEALKFEYFTSELPEPVMPANLLDIAGDWHEFESKQRKRQKGASKKDSRTKATPSSALSSSRPH